MNNTEHASTNEIKEQLDRRQRRTRGLLRKALMELIVEKGFDATTVQDIVERADVSRATFYLHYRTKEELLIKSMTEVYDELVKKSEMFVTEHNLLKAVQEGEHEYFHDPTDFQHVADHADFYKVILSENGVASFVVQVRKYLANLMIDYVGQPLENTGVKPRIPSDMIAHAIAGAQIGVLSWWLETGMKQTPHEISRLFYFLTAYGFWWASGVDFPLPTSEDVTASNESTQSQDAASDE